MQSPERDVATFRRSARTLGFWWRTIITLGIYLLTNWRLNQITLTTRRLTQRRGNLLTGNETSMSLERVTDINVNKSLFGSILGYGDIVIQSAGSDSAEISFSGLAKPDKLRELIFDVKDGKQDEEAI